MDLTTAYDILGVSETASLDCVPLRFSLDGTKSHTRTSRRGFARQQFTSRKIESQN